MKRNKRGISLIVLVITITSTYDEANKIDKIPPENKIKSIRKTINKVEVVDFKSATLLIDINKV